MYGLANQGVKDLVISKFGEKAWAEIAAEANSPVDFVSMQYYPDSLTYALVAAASKTLSLDASAVLGEFGKHWLLFTANEGYGPLMDLFGKDFVDCLRNLNHLHERMGMTMPELAPPRFHIEELGGGQVRLDYFSKRAGLAPMVRGLLEGLAIRHSARITIKDVPAAAGAANSFLITVQEA